VPAATPAAVDPAPPPAPGSASAAVALAQGRLIVALTDLLKQGAAGPVAIKTRVPLASKYSGPDAKLLQLQADAIALALEAFGTAPTQPVRAATSATASASSTVSQGGPPRR
jgi:hypothetical protein